MKVLNNFKVLLDDVKHTKIKLTKEALKEKRINGILKELDNLDYDENKLKESSDILCNIADKLKGNEEVEKYLSDNVSYRNVDDVKKCISGFFNRVIENKFVDSASSNKNKRKKDYTQILKGFRLIAEILEESNMQPIEQIGTLEMIANLMSVCQSGWKATMIEILTRFEKKASEKCDKDEEVQYEKDKMIMLLDEVFFNARVCVAKKLCFDYMDEHEIRVPYRPHYQEIFYKCLNKVYGMNLPITKVGDKLISFPDKVEIAWSFQYSLWENHINVNELVANKAMFLFKERVKEIENVVEKDEELMQYKNFFEMLTVWANKYFKENDLGNEITDVTEFLTEYVMNEDITEIRNIAIKEIMKDYGYIKEKKSNFKINKDIFISRVKMLLEDIKSDEEKEELHKFLYSNNENVEIILSYALEMERYDLVKYIEDMKLDKSTRKKIEKIKSDVWIKVIKSGNIKKIEKFIEMGIDIDVKDANNNTALYIASKTGRLDVLELLLRNNAKVNVICENKHTPLCIACLKENDKVVEKLLEHGANVIIGKLKNTVYDINLSMLLYRVCERRYIEVLKQLVEKGKQENYMYLHPECVICDVCERGDIEELKLLIELKVYVNTADGRDNTPLHIACKNKDLEMVKLLVRAGAYVNERGENANSPLYIACEKGALNVAEFLINNGAELDAENEDGASPLDVAEYKNDYDMVKLLIDKGVNLKNNDASVTLWRAINHRNFEIAQLLIDNGVKAKFSFSSKLLHRACETNDIEVIDLLVKAKVNVNLKNEYGYTPIYKAVLANNTEAIKRLLNAKCDLNIKCGKEKNTVFDIAKGEVKDILEANKGLCEVNKTNKIFNYIRTII